MLQPLVVLIHYHSYADNSRPTGETQARMDVIREFKWSIKQPFILDKGRKSTKQCVGKALWPVVLLFLILFPNYTWVTSFTTETQLLLLWSNKATEQCTEIFPIILKYYWKWILNPTESAGQMWATSTVTVISLEQLESGKIIAYQFDLLFNTSFFFFSFFLNPIQHFIDIL